MQHPRSDESRPSQRFRRLLRRSSSPRAPSEFHPRPDDPRPRPERGSLARLASRRRGERVHRVLQLPPEAKHAHVRGARGRRAVSRRLPDNLRGPSPVFAATGAGHDDPRRPRHVRAPSRERGFHRGTVVRHHERARGRGGERRRSKSFGDFAHARLRRARRASADVGAPGGGGARAPIPRVPIFHRKERPEVPALGGIVVVAVRDPPRRAQGMRERRRAQGDPTVQRARQRVLQTPRKRSQTHHDVAGSHPAAVAFVSDAVAVAASVVFASGESDDSVRDPRERRVDRLVGPGAFVPIERTEHPDGPRDVRSTPRREKREDPGRVPAHHHRRDPRRFAERRRRRVARSRGFVLRESVVEFEFVVAGVSIVVASLGSFRGSSRVPGALFLFFFSSPFLLARGGLPRGSPRGRGGD